MPIITSHVFRIGHVGGGEPRHRVRKGMCVWLGTCNRPPEDHITVPDFRARRGPITRTTRDRIPLGDLMTNHRTEGFADDQLSVRGHTALVTHNHNTGAQSLGCDDCGVHLGRFEPDRWRDKHIREVWIKHLDAWCPGVRITEPGPGGRHQAAKCGSTSTHAGHWTDGRDGAP